MRDRNLNFRDRMGFYATEGFFLEARHDGKKEKKKAS